jgi:hypothetical protein
MKVQGSGTPVVKGKKAERSLVKGDGTKSNPVRSSDVVLRLGIAKEITYTQLHGTPGLQKRKDKA